MVSSYVRRMIGLIVSQTVTIVRSIRFCGSTPRIGRNDIIQHEDKEFSIRGRTVELPSTAAIDRRIEPK